MAWRYFRGGEEHTGGGIYSQTLLVVWLCTFLLDQEYMVELAEYAQGCAGELAVYMLLRG